MVPKYRFVWLWLYLFVYKYVGYGPGTTDDDEFTSLARFSGNMSGSHDVRAHGHRVLRNCTWRTPHNSRYISWLRTNRGTE